MTSTGENERLVILFDGVCNLCTGSVQFVIERDARKRLPLRLAAVAGGGTAARPSRRSRFGRPVEDGKTYRKSGAALRIARRLDGLWPLLAVLLVIPGFLRDAMYDWIGRRRYRMFGKRDVCWTPQPELAERFLD